VSNLSDLLPAGAAAKQLTFTDSGSGIATKKPVILNSDGTVTEVGNASASFGSAQAFATGNYGSPASAYDPDNDRVCTVYIDSDNSYYGTAVVGQISGSSITWGTPLLFESAYTPYPDIDYDTGTNQFVISFVDGSASNFLGVKTAAYAATNSLTFGSKVNGPEYAGGTSIACSSSAFLIVYDGLYGTGIAGTISGTTITLGTEVDYISSGSYQARGSTVVYDSNAGKYLISTADGNNSYNGYGFVTTVTGTSISYGSGAVFDAHAINNTNAVYDSTAQKTVIAYVDLTFSNVQGVVATISGTSVSFGTVYQVIDTSSIGWQLGRQITYDANSNKTYISYTRNSDGYAYILTGTVSGTDITLSDETAYTSASTGELTIVTDTTNNKVGLFYKDMSSTNDGTSKVYSPAGTNLTATNFVGVADSAISASAAGSVIVQGGTVSGITLPANASTFGATVEWEADRSNQTTGVYDPDNQSIVYLYVDVTNSRYPTIVEGNISGDTLTFGTPAVVTSSGANVSAIAYETTSNKFLCQYTDGAYGGDIIGKIVTLSGGTFTMGNSATIFSDSTNYVYNSCVAGGGYVGSVAILDGGTYALHANLIDISGATPTIGTEATLSGVSNNRMYRHTITYDSTSSKFIIVCNDSSSNSYYSIGSVSGSDMTLTSGTQFGDSSADDTTSAYYLAAIDKTFFTSQKASDGTTNLRLASLSGSTLTFGTAVNLGAPVTGTQYMGDVDYDTVNSKIVVTLPSAGGTGDANCFTMDSTGTTLTYNNDRINVGNSVFSYNSTMIYHTAAQKSVLGYDYLDSGATDFAGKSNIFNVGTVPVGSKYFVQTDGTLSTTADTPSVNAGLAISTTSLLLNGDS
jgi:hypothetical protein